MDRGFFYARSATAAYSYPKDAVARDRDSELLRPRSARRDERPVAR